MTDTTFDNYGLPAKLMQALTRNKFTIPTPIQAQTIPLALQKKDILGSAQTGTGKTGAFGIPVIAGLMEWPDAAALIMTPTRELAGQVLKALEPMIPTVDIRSALLIGGEAMFKQLKQLDRKPRLIVGTPGRINDHLERGSLKLGNVRFLVLDETDRMLDMGFGIQIERILKHVPDDRQTLLFSATLPSNITKLSGKYMRDPVRVSVGSTTTPAAKIKQEVIPVTDADKYGKLIEQLDTRKGSVIIFVKTKYGTEKLAAKLNKDDHASDAIHGDLQQRRRERVIQNFRDKKYRILVATDVAARGLDIPHIEHVINYDMPQMPEDYIHRIGRTARAGAEGEAISFLTAADNAKWRAIQRLLGGDTSVPGAPSRGGRGAPRDYANKGGKKFGARKPFWKKDGDRPERGASFSKDRPHREDRLQRDDRRPHRDDRPRHEDRPQREERSHREERPRHEERPHREAKSRFEERPRRDDRSQRDDRPRRDDRPHREDRPQRDDRPSRGRDFDAREKPRGEWSPSDRVKTDRPFAARPHDNENRPRKFRKKFDGKPQSGSGGSDGKPQGKSFGKSFGKPQGKSYGRPQGKSYGKPAGKPAGKR